MFYLFIYAYTYIWLRYHILCTGIQRMCLLGFFNFEGVESEGSTKLKDSAKTLHLHHVFPLLTDEDTRETHRGKHNGRVANRRQANHNWKGQRRGQTVWPEGN